MRIDNDQDDSTKLHRDLVNRLERKLKELEEREISQWEAQSDPDPSKRMPQHVFERLNEKLLKEREEINKALCKAKESIPTPIDYKDQILKFTDALNAIEDPNVSAKTKNQYLKNIIDRIEYERGTTVRITKDNYEKYMDDTKKGLQYHVPMYKIKLKLKYD